MSPPPSEELKVLTVWNDNIAFATPTAIFFLFFFFYSPASLLEIILVSRSSCGMSLLIGGSAC